MANFAGLGTFARGLGSGSVAKAAAGGGGMSLDRILNILGSKGGQTAVNAIGAGMSSLAGARQAGADREMEQKQFDASLRQRQAEAASAASPLGAEQAFAQKQAIAKAILGNARNFAVTPGDSAVAATMGQMTGGARLPEGGFDPAMLERLFGDEATMASLRQRLATTAGVNPGGPIMNLGPMFGGPGAQISSDLAAEQERAARQRELIMRAIDEDIRGERQQPKKNRAMGALSGAASGASLGSMFGPVGTGIGAVLGGIKGLF